MPSCLHNLAQDPEPACDTLLFPLVPFPSVDADERGDLLLKRTEDLGKTFTTIHEDIYSFGYIGAFLFFSVMEDPVSGSHCQNIHIYLKVKKTDLHQS